MNTISFLRKELKKIANPQRSIISQRFFKTGKGEYGEGDVFIGLTVPQSRKVAIKFKSLEFSEITQLLKSKIHEERLIALLILVDNFNTGDEKVQKKIYDFYIKNAKLVNNWDFVDLSADKIVGGYLFSLGRGPVARFPSSRATPLVLLELAKSKNLWERRIAIVATYYFIKNKKFDATLKISEILLNDKHDLIQKAVGWMLREVGNRDLDVEVAFLNKYYKKMPRTMFRYAIEKFPQELRISYLKGKF